jgi:ribonuclease VapC
MVIDASAVLAILFDEPEAAALTSAIADDPVRLMSAASILECSMVIESRYGEAGGRELDLLLHRAHIECAAFSAEQLELARHAHRAFGRGHPAHLNLGDCFAYALSKVSGEPLLFKGDDFRQTDTEPVLIT